MSCKEREKKDELTATVDNYQFCDETCAIAYFTKNEDDVRRENLIKFFTKAKKAREESEKKETVKVVKHNDKKLFAIRSPSQPQHMQELSSLLEHPLLEEEDKSSHPLLEEEDKSRPTSTILGRQKQRLSACSLTSGSLILLALASFTAYVIIASFFSSSALTGLLASVSFFPKGGIDKVLVKESPPQTLDPLPRNGDPPAIFFYEANTPSNLKTGGSEQEAYVYGASMQAVVPADGGEMRMLAVPTGNPGNVVKGWVVIWPAASFTSALLKANEAYGYLRREIVQTVLRDGSVQPAFWFFHVDRTVKDPVPFPSGAPARHVPKWDFGRWKDTVNFFNGNFLTNWIPFVPKPDATIGQDRLGARGDLVVDFTSPSFVLEETFGVLDDVVMGGRSLSNAFMEGDRLVLKGETISANGGFCSVRTKNVKTPFNFQGKSAISFSVASEPAQTLKFILRDEEGWNSIAFQVEFDAVPTPRTVSLPFNNFQPVKTGRRIRPGEAGYRELQLAHIYSLQLMISKFSVIGQLNPGYREGQVAQIYTRCAGVTQNFQPESATPPPAR
eukprot:g5654.t1